MKQTSEAREHKKILELVRRYKKEGYAVQRDQIVPDTDIPADLIVQKDGQTIVIEVKTSESIRSEKGRLVRLGTEIGKMPGVRLDLVLTNPRRRSADRDEHEKVVGRLGLRPGSVPDSQRELVLTTAEVPLTPHTAAELRGPWQLPACSR